MQDSFAAATDCFGSTILPSFCLPFSGELQIMSKYTKKDAAKDTDVSISEVSRAWHAARDDAMKAGELPERAANKAAKSDSSKSKGNSTSPKSAK